MNRNLATVPARYEVGATGSTIAVIDQWAPSFDTLVLDDG